MHSTPTSLQSTDAKTSGHPASQNKPAMAKSKPGAVKSKGQLSVKVVRNKQKVGGSHAEKALI